MDLIRIIFSVLIPPLGVFLQVGLGAQFWINILLTLLGYIPGLIHAIYIIARRQIHNVKYDKDEQPIDGKEKHYG